MYASIKALRGQENWAFWLNGALPEAGLFPNRPLLGPKGGMPLEQF